MRCNTNVAQKVPADYADHLHHFRQTIIRLRKAKAIDPSAIVNMDQTMCRFDMPRARTNDSRGKKDHSGEDDLCGEEWVLERSFLL